MAPHLRRLIIVGILFLGITYVSIWALLRQKPNLPVLPSANEAQLILYTKPGCAFCENVHRFIEQQNIAQKVEFIERNAQDLKVAQELATRATSCGIAGNQIGVPLLWDAQNSKCIVGDQLINAFLGQKAGQSPKP
jgi:glutaredoxin